jgi:uncharacterized protein (TIGR03905 family)
MTEYSYRPTGCCATRINFALEDGKIYNVVMEQSCPGNSLAISKLIQGKDAAEVAEILRGNRCAGNSTSCADQLSKAIDLALANESRTA